MTNRPGAGELSDELVAEVTELCERGDEAVEQARYDDAIAHYEAAFSRIPRPVYAWKVTAWILTALGETHFFKKDHARAQHALTEAMRCPGAAANPFLHLRLGQVELELGNKGRARDELFRAYQRAGADIFEGEDPRYFALVEEELRRDD